MSTEGIRDRQQLQLTVAVPLTEGTDSSDPFQGIPRILYDPKTHHLHETDFYSFTPSARPPPPKKKIIWGQTSIIISHLRLGRSRRCLPQVFRPQLTMQRATFIAHPTHVNFANTPRYGPNGQQCQRNVYQPYNTRH